MNRTIPLLLATALAAASGAAAAQDFVFGWNPRTGDVWVDNTLGDMNRYGYRYRDSFVDELVRYHGAPRDYVLDLLVQQRWAPGDVYYACAIAQVIGRSCRYVAEEWERDHGQGWGALAQRLGIKPGSEEFHRLKQGFVPTYDRWARPIRLDDPLRAAYPDRGKGHAAGERGRGNANDNPGKGRGNSGNAGNHGNSDHARGNGNGNGNSGKAKGNQGKGQGKDHGKGKGNQGKGHGKD
jgi:hypothetical protein